MSPLLEPGTLDFISHSETQTRRLGGKLGHLVEPGDVIVLNGDLGVGKTRWAQGFGYGVGVPSDEVINSPTYTFINHYAGRLPFYHIDLYRLADTAEADTLALEEYFYGDGVCVVEWGSRASNLLPPDRLEITLYHLADTKRRLVMKALGDGRASDLLNTFKHRAFGIPAL